MKTILFAALALAFTVTACEAKKAEKPKAKPAAVTEHHCPAGMDRVPQANANILACKARDAHCPAGLVEVSQANGVLACKAK